MSSCNITSMAEIFIKAQYKAGGIEAVKRFCIDKNISFEDAMKLVETGASVIATPVITNVSQTSRWDGYKSKEEDLTNNIVSYYNDRPDMFVDVKKEFVSDVIVATLINLEDDNVFKNPEQYIFGKGTLLNVELSNLKIKYINDLLSKVRGNEDVDSLFILEKDSESVKEEKFNTILAIAWDNLHLFKGSEDYFNILNLYVKSKYFDTFIDDQMPYININHQYKNIFSNKRYEFTNGKVSHYKGLFGDSEFADAKDQISDMAKMVLNFLPETHVDSEGRLHVIKNSFVGYDGFSSVTQKFKSWIQEQIINNPDIAAEFKKGTIADYGKLMNLWMNSDKISSVEMLKINTINRILFGKKDGRYITPDRLRWIFAHMIENTETSGYLEIEQSTGNPDIITPKTLTEKRYLTAKKELQHQM